MQKTVQSLVIGKADFDMSFVEFEQFCKEVLKGNYFYLKNNGLHNDEKNRICNESKNLYEYLKL